MSDYLHTLAARSLNLAPIATPRLTARFEPSRPAGGTTAVPQGPAVETEEASLEPGPPREMSMPVARELPPPPAAPVSAAPPRAVAQVQSSRVEHDSVDRRREHSLRVNADRAAEALPRRDVVAQAIHGHTPEVDPPETTALSESHVAPPTTRDANPEPIRTDAHAPQAVGLSDIVMRLTEDRLTARERSRAREAERAQPAPDRREYAVPAAQPTVERGRPVVKPAARAASNTPVENTDAPAVRITIGRIEVRALMPQAPGPLPRPVSPASPSAPSLEEYLRQRSGARR